MPDAPISRTGLLIIRVSCARGLSLPHGASIPPATEVALSTNEAEAVSSMTPQSFNQQHRLTQQSGRWGNLQRNVCWWLPYVVLEFDKDQVVIDPLGGTIQEPVWMFQTRLDVTRVSDIALHFYLRDRSNTEDLNNYELGQSDLFMGNLAFVPDFDRRGTVEQWYDVTSGTGQVNVAVTFRAITSQLLSVDSFDLLRTIGKASFGHIMKVRKKDTSHKYALKIIRKSRVASWIEVTDTLVERSVLAQVNSPFIVPLKFSFQSPTRLYLLLPYMSGIDLFYHLQREKRFDEERSRFYAAELLLALEHLHAFDVIYRELKPDNIWLDYTGHIAVSDFSLCRLTMSEQDDTKAYSSNDEWSAPELILGHDLSKTADWWTLGMALYEMLAGLPPYYDENTSEMFRKILQDPLCFGDEFRPDACSLLTALLTRDPSQRLGANGAEEIKKHPFFAKYIDFERLLAKKILPPFKPRVARSDVRYSLNHLYKEAG
ncbi:hypothetical protein FRC01_001567 [Tulasnella sp. 417]|nr:hypothetical protein FRC01_001567 [Tulasnella sp. 417]